MKEKNPAAASSGRMYENPILEKLTTTSPRMMVPFHLIIASGCIYWGVHIGYSSNPLTIGLLFIAGMFFWTFAEYALHRWIFHYVHDAPVMKTIHYAIHGYHHNAPRDAKRLYMPPIPAIVILLIFFGLFYLTMGNAAWFFLPGFEIGYLMYASVHYGVHTRKPPKRLKHLWLHHQLHHHKYPNLAFGVSNTFWDKVFRTMPPKRKKMSA